jgi:hypothetical protein
MDISSNLHGIECKTPKFLKNSQVLIFQKLAGSGFASVIPNLLSAESKLVPDYVLFSANFRSL